MKEIRKHPQILNVLPNHSLHELPESSIHFFNRKQNNASLITMDKQIGN